MDMIDPPGVQRVVVEHVVRTSDVTAQHTTLRLRSFSGKIPRPPNEPDFETWRANVRFLLDDPSVSDLSRTRRILDSLLPPAADVIKHVSPQSSPSVYLELLESVYGSVEDGEELLAKFMTMLQNQGEKPSSYLHRLQVMLSAAVRRGGIAESERDRCLLKQFCRGCWDNGLIANLQLERRKINPPSFAELVVSVRTEEDRQASKEDRMRSYFGVAKQGLASSKPRAATHQLSAHSPDAIVGAVTETDSMRKQISEIHAQLASMQPLTHQKCQPTCSKAMEVTSLKKELTELRAQIQAVEAAVSQQVPNRNSEVEEIVELTRLVAELKAQLTVSESQKHPSGRTSEFRSPSAMSQPKQTRHEESKSVGSGGLTLARPRPGYCFRCGEDAERETSSVGPEKPRCVPTVKLQTVSVAGLTETEARPTCPNKPERVFNKCCDTVKQEKLPRGLVGLKCTAQLFVEGTPVNCLLDTGSQVTTIPLSFYQDHLSSHPLKSLESLLEVEGANGQSVPYLGYVELTLTFPKEFLGVKAEVHTLALVVPDLIHVPQVLVGTNSLDALYANHAQENPENLSPAFNGYRAVLKILDVRHKQMNTEVLGCVMLAGTASKVVSAGSVAVLDGVVHLSSCPTENFTTLEQPVMSSMPGGLLVASGLYTLPAKRSFSLPVLVRNDTQHDIAVPPKAVIAEMHAIQCAIETKPGHDVSQTQTNSDSLQIKFDFGNSPLPAEWKSRISAVLNTMSEVFALHDMDYGHTDKVKHRIRLSDETPFKHRPRPIHPQDVDAVRKHLQDLLAAGIIRESESPFASPIVVVRKKNNSVRLCIDFRKLNSQTIKDAYALPNLEEVFSVLTGSKWFSVLDLKSGYYQIEMEETDKHKTAFVCPQGFWEFNRMPQGITNAPSSFQRLMERCMGDLNRKKVLVFIDDLIVFSETLEEHEHRLVQVLTRLKEYGLKLSPEKCKFFQTSVRYLGHIVSEYGVETDPDKIEAIKTWPRPQTLKELKSFLGFAGYYRRFVQDFSKIVKPLNNLTAGYPPLRKGRKSKDTNRQYYDPKGKLGDRWDVSCQEAFETIVEKLTTAPVLGYADSRLPYILHTDASTVGLGAALYQEQDGQLRVLAYASRGLNKSEARYPAHKLEFLALKWAITTKFSDYLYGTEFTVVTDSNPLTYILTSAKLDSTSYRWLSGLSTYNFKIQYRAGAQNQDADGLSRRPNGQLMNDLESQKEQERIKQFTLNHLAEVDKHSPVILPEAVKAVCEKHQVSQSQDGHCPVWMTLAESLTMNADALPQEFREEFEHGLPVVPYLSEEDLVNRQRADPELKEVLEYLESGEKPLSRKNLSPTMSMWMRQWNKLEVKNGVLYRKRMDQGRELSQLVLPEDLREMVLTSLHDDMGHLGLERTLDLLRSRFYWPKMADAVERKVKTCERCIRRKSPPQKAAPLVNIKTSRPLELVCMDYLTVEPDNSNTKDILVITDHFTRYAIAVPTKDQKARTVARCLWDHFLLHYGFPEKLHSDQGPDFESRTIQELCKVAGIRKVRTTPYHPRGNPVERFNRTLLQMLGTLENDKKAHWKEFVKPLVHAYNCTKNDATGYSPYEMMFGRQPRLPVDLAFGLPVSDSSHSHSQYVKSLKDRLEESYRLASRNALKVAGRNKRRFDRNVVASVLDVGDRVLVRNVRLRGKHKIADRWEPNVYVVLKKNSGIPVYTVCPEGKEGPMRTLHRDLLLPCGFLPNTEFSDSAQQKEHRRPRTRAQSRIENAAEEETVHSQSESDSESVHFDVPGESLEFTTKVILEGRPTHHSESSLVTRNLPEVVSESPPSVVLDRLRESAPAERNLTSIGVERNSPEMCHGEPDASGVEPEKNREDELVQVISEQECNDSSEVPDESFEVVNEVGPDAHVENTHPPSPSVRHFPDIPTVADEAGDMEPRRSKRQSRPPDKLQYARLGNPLISVIQSLLQGLSSALSESVDEHDHIAYNNTGPSVDSPV
ncbi:uncharacterized protein [Garra rufa]|uniref:uncharacterized protein n=1 Tax=Garra rufa TaxID=137080 RepID=UPI003CCE60E3